MECPFGPSILLVAELDGNVVGFGAWLRWRFVVRGRRVDALRGIDFVVDPAHRGHRVLESLIKFASSQFPSATAFTFSTPNQRAAPGARRSGRRKVDTFRAFVRPSRPLLGAMRRWSSSRAGRSFSVDAEHASTALTDDRLESVVADHSDRLDDRYATALDLEHLRWRYRFDEYRAVRTDPGSRQPGIAIFRLRPHGLLWESRVCELLVAGGDRRTAGRLLRRVARASRADLLSCGFRSRCDAARHGFVASPQGMVLMARAIEPDLTPDPTRRASWALSLGDLELL